MSDELEPFRKAAELGCPDFRAWPDGRVTFRCLSFHDLPRPDRNFEHHVRINRYAAAVCMAFWVESKEVFHKGWPDFLMFKDGQIRMIEVKRKQRRTTRKMGLSAHQRRIKAILEKHFPYEVRYEE